MRAIKCADCDNYRNEWCEKVMDSTYPDMLRDCQYFCERRDLVEVVRCKDCKHFAHDTGYYCTRPNQQSCNLIPEDYCSYAERKDEVEE